MIVDGSEDDLVVDDTTLLLGSDGQGICHEIVDQTRISTGVTVDSSESSIIDDAA